MISCVSLPSATLSSVPIYDYAIANEELAGMTMEEYYPCCGKSICRGCFYSFAQSGNSGKCPFCNTERGGKTDEEENAEMMKRVEAKDVGAMHVLAGYYHQGAFGLHQDRVRAMALWKQAADLGSSQAHYNLGSIYHEGGDLKMTKSHYEAAAMAGHEMARCNLGFIEGTSGNVERAVKHWTIAASSGCYTAMHALRKCFERGEVGRDAMNSTLTAYNNSCAEMRSEARDAAISKHMVNN
jgi:TPR repeat protein